MSYMSICGSVLMSTDGFQPDGHKMVLNLKVCSFDIDISPEQRDFEDVLCKHLSFVNCAPK